MSQRMEDVKRGPRPRPRPLSAAEALGRTPVFKEPCLDRGRMFWLEQRPHQGGRTTLMMAPFAGGPDVSAGRLPIELTPGSWNLRSRIHEYGGGAYVVEGSRVVFVDDGDRCLWRLDLPADPWSQSPPAPRRLIPDVGPESSAAYADGLIDRSRCRWLGVMEEGGRDHLVAVNLEGGHPLLLHTAADFCGYAVLSPSGDQLAWVEWQQPFMPWDRSELWLGQCDAHGAIRAKRRIAGSGGGDACPCSVFQPLWTPAGDLVVANDRSGWWNLERLAARDLSPPHDPLPEPAFPCWQPLLPTAAEFAMPQWVYGMRTTVWDGQHLVAAVCRQGSWELGRIVSPSGGPDPSGGVPAADSLTWQPVVVPFDDLAALSAEDGRLVAIASSAIAPSGLLEVDLASGDWRHTPAAPCPMAIEAISRPEPLWFSGHGDRRTHAWFYPPAGGAHPAAPLLVKGHSGPTGMARPGLSLAIQFWTSRGWGVVDVNYGGSTGFGRAYRQRLDGQWGVVDVSDCAAAARALVATGRADAGRVAIEGGSAGGFTVLAALCCTDVFAAGACRYPVSDLSSLAAHDHRFEARYLDGLIGPWPAAMATYTERSPIHHAHNIRCPVIFFHGLNDQVVPPEQTERMVRALAAHDVPVQLHLLPDEGHGFRRLETQIQVLEATEAFFRRHLRLP